MLKTRRDEHGHLLNRAVLGRTETFEVRKMEINITKSQLTSAMVNETVYSAMGGRSGAASRTML